MGCQRYAGFIREDHEVGNLLFWGPRGSIATLQATVHCAKTKFHSPTKPDVGRRSGLHTAMLSRITAPASYLTRAIHAALTSTYAILQIFEHAVHILCNAIAQKARRSLRLDKIRGICT
jgi:hypothetical protein